MTTEVALRLGWEILAICPTAFLLQFRHNNENVMYDKWADIPEPRKTVPHCANLAQYFEGKTKMKAVAFGV